MGTKLRAFIIVVIVAMGLSTAAVGQARESTDSSTIGPYTEILIPLGDLPELNEDLAYHPLIDSGTFSLVTNENLAPENAGARIQVLYVLEDPRDVPLARYASNDGSDVVLPNASLINQNLKTINVYVRVKAPLHKAATDSILTSESTALNWPALYVVPLSFELEGISTYPCAPVEYADGTSPYKLPDEIDGGEAVREDGLYDPAAYAPPKPWYFNEDPLLKPGEVREGWVSCLAPDLPLEQLQVKYRHTMIPEPEIVFAEKDRPLGGPYPELSELDVIGLTNNDLPQTIGECAEMDYCLEGSGVTLDQCKYAAQEAGLEQGLCVQGILDLTDSEGEGIINLNSTDPEAEISEARVFYTIEHEDLTQKSYLLWNYTIARSFPVSLIRLEDVPLTFLKINSNIMDNDIIRGKGSVTFYDPMIDYNASDVYDPQRDHTWGAHDDVVHDYALFSRVVVKPDNLSREDLEGYKLNVIGAKIDALVEQEGIILSGSNQNLVNNDYFVQSSDPFEGIIYVGIGEVSEPFSHEGYGPLRPGTALINIYPVYDGDQTQPTRHSFHPVNVISIFRPGLVAETNMCDVVDCVEYWDEDDEYRDVTKPPRSIPVMCAGEWANNIIVDDLQVVKFMEYIGEPWGLGGGRGATLHWDHVTLFDAPSHVFLYDIRIMGGATPWWINTKSFDPLGYIYGHTVDMETGWPTHNDVVAIPYYSIIENDLSKGFLARGSSYPGIIIPEKSGWMGEIIDQKVLAFSSVDSYDDGENYKRLNKENTGFLLLEEGPMWIQGCQRELVSALSSQALYAPEDIILPPFTNGIPHSMNSLLPGLTYPKGLSVVDGKVYSMGEYGDTYTFDKYSDISHFKFTVQDVGIIRGKPDRSVVYVPTEDKFYPAEEFPNWNNELFFANNNAFVIPPDTTYVEIRVGVDYLEISEGLYCGIDDEDLQLVYPGYLPINGVIETKPGVPKICRDDDFSFRMAFLFPSLDFELEKMLFSIRGGAQKPWNFWRLVDN